MNTFNNLIGQKILAIKRLDNQVDYEFYSPYAIILTIDGQNEKLIISATNDGSSVDIRLTTDEQIEYDYGLEFSEHTLNELRKDDELNEFVGNNIHQIKIAEFKLPEIKGADFVILQGKYAGIELKTDKHKLLFKNNYGGWCDIDDDLAQISNKESWKWK
jgi:hypothetical protein